MKPALPLQQHTHFGAALRIIGRDVGTVNINGAAPVQTIRRFGFTFAPRGPIWTRDQNRDGLHDSKIQIINSDTARQNIPGYRQIMTAGHVAELDLTGSSQMRLNAAKGKWRNSLHKSHRAKLTFHRTHFDAALHSWLLDADLRQQRIKGYRALPHSIIHAFAAHSPRDVVIFTAKQKRDVVAAMLFLRHAPVVTYHIGWSSDAGRAVSAHHALLLHSADSFASDGYTRLDLGSVDTENAPGLARFKIGCGAAVRALGGTWLRMPGFS